MPVFKRDDVELYYEEHGMGFPVLLIAPGGMRSAVSFWERTPWNPIDQLAPHYRVIAMDQRNAGKSVAPIRPTDSWHVYTVDQLALLDDLGILQEVHVRRRFSLQRVARVCLSLSDAPAGIARQ